MKTRTPPSQPAPTSRAQQQPGQTIQAGRRGRTGYVIGVLLLLACIAPFIVSSYSSYLLSTWFAYAIAVMGARVLFGMCGQLSLAQATFVGIGAYTAAIASQDLQLTALYELVAVVVVSGGFAALIAIPATRVSGLRLALLTLCFSELFQWAIQHWRDRTGGPQGHAVAAFYIPGVDTTDPVFLYFMCLIAAALSTVALARLPHLQLGRAMFAVRDSSLAAQSVGVSISRTRLAAFVIAGIAAGLSGWLIAHVQGIVTPDSYDLFASVYILVGVVLGGTGSTWGAWVGAAYVSLVPPLFASLGQDRLYVLVSGVLLIVIIYLLPRGLVDLPHTLRSLRSKKRRTS